MIHSKWMTFYHMTNTELGDPWFAIGPVWHGTGPKGPPWKVRGIRILVGPYNLAIHTPL